MQKTRKGRGAGAARDDGETIFVLRSVRREDGPDRRVMERRVRDAYALIAVVEGHGRLRANGRELDMAKGKVFLLRPGTVFGAEAFPGAGMRLTYFEIEFQAVPLGGVLQADLAFRVGFPREEELCIAPFSKLLLLAEEMYARETASAGKTNPVARLRNNGKLQELIAFLLECAAAPENSGGDREAGASRRAVERSIAYLRESYREEIGVAELANRAGVGRSQYTRLFREMTGKSPIEFMTELRIERAKELLATTGDKLRDIASLTGFRDEYYFNRRFKQTVGMSPKQYMQSRKERLKVLSMEYLGELLALGVRPVAAARYLTEFMAGEERVPGMADIGDVEEELETIIGLKPDLILLRDGFVPGAAECLERIAPVAKVAWDDDVFAHVDAIAGILGKEREGRAWIRRYESKADRAKRIASSRIASGETAALLGVFPDFMCVFSDRNVGHTFYRVLGFEPPPLVKKMISEREEIGGRNITGNELMLYDADRIYVMVHGGQAAEARLRRLTESREWQALSAVKSGQVEKLDGRWFPYDAYTLEWQIDEALKLLERG